MQKITALVRSGVIALSLACASTAAIAQENPLSARSEVLPTALANLTDKGVRLTFLDERGGVRGYLGESRDGKMQVFYLMPDNDYVIVGTLLRADGLNITGLQIADMQDRFAQFRNEVEAKNADISTPQTDTPPSPRVANATPYDQKVSAVPVVVEPSPVAAVGSAEDKDWSKSDAYVSRLAKETFLTDVAKTAFFTVGDAEKQPLLYMVADPNCPFCHRAWAKLQPLISDNKLAVQVILIAGLKGSAPKTRSILAGKEPGRAWWLGQGSKDGVEVPAEPAAGTEDYKRADYYLKLNNDFATKVGLSGTPFFAYVGSDGKLYSAEGPDDLAGFLDRLMN
ncbi:thioredoxin fold domain-containing protein [Thalassospira xianhensis]|uniref:Thioredoxin-like domain-containing protein n=2 Tax=Thalassospira TaxID=168934 RepID=A0A285TXT7_9PROT|nr:MULTISPECIES: thioredoxin fold domain-containing protein [Thalassospira]RCK07829.1 hypothetical protein TH5_02010 [Thalassospira xianhensis MCCC 1A02616]SOC27133.1 Thioredoxin-like domain-containing protein [Thalassospira xiamenensis]